MTPADPKPSERDVHQVTEIIRKCRGSGNSISTPEARFIKALIEEFALALAAERERCAKVADLWAAHVDHRLCAKEIAAAIRNGGRG